MTAQVDVLTGEKTVLDYLLKPILKAKDTALRGRLDLAAVWLRASGRLVPADLPATLEAGGGSPWRAARVRARRPQLASSLRLRDRRGIAPLHPRCRRRA